MKKYIIASFVVLLSLKCHSGEWIAVGEQPELPSTHQLEKQLWEHLKAESNIEFKPNEIYRYQYKFIGESLILINALCLQSSEGETDIGTYPGPTTEELKKQLYQVQDGGSCFFNIKYNLKSARFHSLYVNSRA
jgi:hypothetical protein